MEQGFLVTPKDRERLNAGGHMAKSKRNLTPTYLKAMERIENGTEYYTCLAIDPRSRTRQYDSSDNVRYSFATRLYAKIFSPNGKCFSGRGEPVKLSFVYVVDSDPNPKALHLNMLALASVCWRDFVDD